MKIREDRWLKEQVGEWVRGGLISGAQGNSILARYEGPGKATLLSIPALLASLGGFCVALGIILVVAFNWDRIPSWTKIGVFLALLAVAAEAFARLEKASWAQSALGIVWLALPLAGIGLWAQVFQLSGDPLRPILLFLLLGLPLAIKTESRPVIFTHTAGIVWAAYTGALSPGTWISLRGEIGESMGGSPAELGHFIRLYGPAFLGTVALWWAAFHQVRTTLGGKSRFAWALAFLTFLACLGLSETIWRVSGTAMGFHLFGSLCVLYWGIRSRWSRGEVFWDTFGFMLLFILLYVFSTLWHDWGRSAEGGAIQVVGVLAILGAGVLLMLGRPLERMGTDAVGAWGFRALLGTPVVLSYLMLLGLGNEWVAVLSTFALVAYALWFVREGVRGNRPSWINGGVFLLGFVFLTRFLDYFGSMLESGVAFIALGLLFVALAYGLNRGRQKLLERAKEGRA